MKGPSDVTEEAQNGFAERVRKTGGALRKALPRSPRVEFLLWGLFSGLAFYFLWSAFSGSQGAVELVRLKGALEQLEKENDVLLRENQEMEKEVYLLQKSRSYLEKVAREEYGYAYPGETVYSLSEPDSASIRDPAEAKKDPAGPGIP